MNFRVIEHPLVAHKLTLLRDQLTPTVLFRDLVEELVMLLAYESTKDIEVVPKKIQTPICETEGVSLGEPQPVVVPIIRAGLGMLSGMLKLLPSAEVGFLGMKRDEQTLDNVTYANRLPKSLEGRRCFILDPMLATGGTIAAAARYLTDKGAKNITSIALLSAPEGVEFLRKSISSKINLTVISASLDDRLNELGYIVPGLGDAGDRLYGSVD
ncbi:MAG: uracil phosphoribosyltransferase [Bifidobacteriaceae bacterium]|nr:uracil phosphoribosyltransferase [Bifidobacteriaceae bacterium]